MLTPKDWTLLAIAATNRPLEPVQLQKSLFLLGKNFTPAQLHVEEFYQFAPYDYGPFSSAIYEDADQLERDGLVQIQRPPQTRFNLYSATPAGAAHAAELAQSLDPRSVDYLRRVVTWASSLSFNQLVSAIYKAYPEMKENSVFAG